MDRRARIIESSLARGAEHHRAGRWTEAGAAYAEALRADPGNPDAHALLGAVLLRLDRPADALALLDRGVSLAPDHALAQLNRGRALLAVAPPRPEDALAAFDAALARRPGFAEALVGRARALSAAGRPEDADDAWVVAARATPLPDLSARRLVAWREEGRARLAAADPRAADAFRRALAVAPDDRAARVGLVDALMLFPEAATRHDLDLLLADDGLDAQRLGPAAARVVGVPVTADAPGAADPLLHRWLHRAVLATPATRAAARALRRDAMARARDGAEVSVALLVALAVEAWHAEHADLEEADHALADALAALPATVARRAALAVVRPVTPPLPDDPALAPLVAVQWEHPAAERALAAALPALAPAHDTTTRDSAAHDTAATAASAAVRALYEENPYPRLVGFHRREAEPFAAYVRHAVPTLRDAPDGPVRVLVAGGGTGQHPLSVASAIAASEVVAIDLSRASLGRAARLARAHGVGNLRFVQGDLFALGRRDGLGRFDFIDCVGVLHHLADPLAGARVLVGTLAPGGLVRLGLYSERGRSDVVAARDLAAAHGWRPTPDGLRAARRALLALPPDHPAAGLAASVDLYSQSGLRDLVFHPCEHRYTPRGVAALCAAAGLVVVGVQHARPEAARRYAARWPDDLTQADLDRWDALEAEHPRLFAGMIHVWCRLRTDAGG